MKNVLDRSSGVSPLGVRFWDAVTRSFVSEGLSVVAHPTSMPSHRVAVLANPSGIFMAQDLPGMRELERGAGDDAYWRSVARKRFVVEVDDTLGRYLPFSFTADLPIRGLLVGPGVAGTPLASEPHDGALLFSTSTRAAPAGLTVIHAELWDAGAPTPSGSPLPGAPAAGALIMARVAGDPPVYGVTDAEGRAALFFACPEPPAPGQRSWPVTLSVRYARAAVRSRYPDLAAVLAQPAASLVTDPARGFAFSAEPRGPGEPLILRSSPASTRLFVSTS